MHQYLPWSKWQLILYTWYTDTDIAVLYFVFITGLYYDLPSKFRGVYSNKYTGNAICKMAAILVRPKCVKSFYRLRLMWTELKRGCHCACRCWAIKEHNADFAIKYVSYIASLITGIYNSVTQQNKTRKSDIPRYTICAMNISRLSSKVNIPADCIQ